MAGKRERQSIMHSPVWLPDEPTVRTHCCAPLDERSFSSYIRWYIKICSGELFRCFQGVMPLWVNRKTMDLPSASWWFHGSRISWSGQQSPLDVCCWESGPTSTLSPSQLWWSSPGLCPVFSPICCSCAGSNNLFWNCNFAPFGNCEHFSVKGQQNCSFL